MFCEYGFYKQKKTELTEPYGEKKKEKIAELTFHSHTACFWTLEGIPSPRQKPVFTLGAHANNYHLGSNQ